MAGFEVFTRRMVPLARVPYVTIQKRGTISLNAAAHAAIGGPQAVELLYDTDESLMALRAVEETVEHAYPLRNQSSKSTGPYIVAGTAFTKYYGIDTSVSRRWPVEQRDDLLIVDFKQEGTVVTSNRGGGQKDVEDDG